MTTGFDDPPPKKKKAAKKTAKRKVAPVAEPRKAEPAAAPAIPIWRVKLRMQRVVEKDIQVPAQDREEAVAKLKTETAKDGETIVSCSVNLVPANFAKLSSSS